MRLSTSLQRAILVCLSAGMLLAIAPTSAFGWRSDGLPLYPTRTVRVFMVAPATATTPAAGAMRAINASGARVRLVRTLNRSTAHIVLARFVTTGDSCDGETRYRIRETIVGTRVIKHPRGLTVILMEVGGCDRRLETTRLLTHEFGHALGLTHERARCATMNATMVDAIPDRCDVTLTSTQYFCGLLELDDVRGLVARWGGVVGPRPQRICTYPQPPGPTDATVTYSGTTQSDWRAHVTYTAPLSPATSVVNALGMGRCITPGEHENAPSHVPVAFVPGASTSVDVTYQHVSSGSWCMTLFARGPWAQTSTPTYISMDVPVLPET